MNGVGESGSELLNEPSSNECRGLNASKSLKRVHFVFDDKTIRRLNRIQETHGEPSLAQAAKEAIAMLDWLDKKKQEGYKLCLRKGDELYEVFIPE